ncbi:MAG: rRNA maturation RNase YbeY [Candidatus Paceibacterota bacterium]
METGISITNKTRVPFPRLPVLEIKQEILGEKYSLSIVFVSNAKSRELNKAYRGKDKATNILSFPLTKSAGEIVLCPAVITREAKERKFDKNFRELVGFLVIHGMLHLKGNVHSSRMEKAENKYDQKYFGGNRHRLIANSSRGRRVRQRREKS